MPRVRPTLHPTVTMNPPSLDPPTPRAVPAVLADAGFIVGPFLGFNLKHHAGWFDESWGLTWLALAVIVGGFNG